MSFKLIKRTPDAKNTWKSHKNSPDPFPIIVFKHGVPKGIPSESNQKWTASVLITKLFFNFIAPGVIVDVLRTIYMAAKTTDCGIWLVDSL